MGLSSLLAQSMICESSGRGGYKGRGQVGLISKVQQISQFFVTANPETGMETGRLYSGVFCIFLGLIADIEIGLMHHPKRIKKNALC